MNKSMQWWFVPNGTKRGFHQSATYVQVRKEIDTHGKQIFGQGTPLREKGRVDGHGPIEVTWVHNDGSPESIEGLVCEGGA
jgi:hypothetical protein